MYSFFLHRVNTLLAPALALCSWVSLNPYPLWGSNKYVALAGVVAGVLAVMAFLVGDRPRRSEVLGFALMALFIIYISCLPKADGGQTRWFFVLPTMLALFVFEDVRRAALIKVFSVIFAASLTPGIVVSLLSIAGVDLGLVRKPLLNPVMAAAGGYYLHAPGVLLHGGGSTSLPWGGGLYRLCAIYDEPGMVGTISAFLLAAYRFRVKSPVSVLILIGGLLSFSLAFTVLAVVGFCARLVLMRTARTIIPLVLCILVGMLVAGIIVPDSALRQTQYINNRSLPEMQRLLGYYWSSDVKTLMFGISSDASVIYGGLSQVVYRIFTDFGMVGMFLFAGAITWLAFAMLSRADSTGWALLFFGLFMLSIYQRPIIWMPYAFTLFVCCPFLEKLRRDSVRPSEMASPLKPEPAG